MMTNKEISLKSVIFLVIGVLLLLSLVICIFLVKEEKDLVKIAATVTSVESDNDGTGKNNITLSYNIDNVYYKYELYYKDAVSVDDKVEIYYHEKNPKEVQTYKTSKLIFVCPIVGLMLCVIGLITLTKKSNENDLDKDYETKVLEINGKTQMLKIITDDDDESVLTQMEVNEEEEDVKLVKTGDIPVIKDDGDIKVERHSKTPTPIAFKDSGVKKEEELPIKKVLPLNYYVSNLALVYEENDDESEEINLEDIKKVIKTINSEDEIVKITVISKDVTCCLTSVNGIDLNTTYNLLHNKLLGCNEDYIEEVEHKEY